MLKPPFTTLASEHVWRTCYRWVEGGHRQEPGIEATWDRVALAVSAAEPHHRDDWCRRFRAMLGDFRFLPGSRLLAGAGTVPHAVLASAYVMGPVEDSLQGIFNALRESMLTLQWGGSVGIDFSTLRPAGSRAVRTGGMASGPVSFMRLWAQSAAVLETGSPRHGAMMAALRCDHPDIEAFMSVKHAGETDSRLGLCVLVTDDFMRAVDEGAEWPLVFPLAGHPIPEGGEVCERRWCGSLTPQLCLVHRRIPARSLWAQLQQAEHVSAEPGVLFMDRINRANNLWYCENLTAASPSGDIPLPPFGVGITGSINLTRLVQHAFGEHPHLDFGGLRAIASVATRFLDDVHDISAYPLKPQEKAAQASRRIGLGVTGLADTLAMLGLRFGSPASLDLAREIIAAVRDTAYSTSIELAREKGGFPSFDKTKFGASSFVLDLSPALQDAIAQLGIRNSHLLSVESGDTISLLAGNVSQGTEPVAAFRSVRRLPDAHGDMVAFELEDAAYRQYHAVFGTGARLPAHFVEAASVPVDEQLAMLAAVQSGVDNAVHGTVYLPPEASADDVGDVLRQAWQLGLKACSARRRDAPGHLAQEPL
jgi:ribonucleoside-diphosphate reductase alpha chain